MIFICIFLLSGVAFCNVRYKKLAVVGYILLGIIYCCRGEVGPDFSAYEYYYHNIHNDKIVLLSGFERGYVFISEVFYDVGLPYLAVQGLIGILVVTCFFIFVKSFTNSFGLALFLGMYYYFYPAIGSVRQAVCVALFAASLKYLNIDWKKYWVMNSIGCFFHRSGLLTLFFYFFYKSKLVRYVSILMFVCSYFLLPYIGDLLQYIPAIEEKYNFYFVKFGSEQVSRLLSAKNIEYLFLLIGMKWIEYKENVYPKRIEVIEVDV